MSAGTRQGRFRDRALAVPKPRSASLQAAHQRDCTNATKTSLDSLQGCTCKPSYYTSYRQVGRVVKGPRVRNPQVAERGLRKPLVELDEDRAEVGPSRRNARTFDEWADEYLRILEEDKRDKGSTIRAYESTLGHVRPILGRLDLDEIGVPDPPGPQSDPRERQLRRDATQAPSTSARGPHHRRRRRLRPLQPADAKVHDRPSPRTLQPCRSRPSTPNSQSSGRRWKRLSTRRSTST